MKRFEFERIRGTSTLLMRTGKRGRGVQHAIVVPIMSDLENFIEQLGNNTITVFQGSGVVPKSVRSGVAKLVFYRNEYYNEFISDEASGAIVLCVRATSRIFNLPPKTRRLTLYYQK